MFESVDRETLAACISTCAPARIVVFDLVEVCCTELKLPVAKITMTVTIDIWSHPSSPVAKPRAQAQAQCDGAGILRQTWTPLRGAQSHSLGA